MKGKKNKQKLHLTFSFGIFPCRISPLLAQHLPVPHRSLPFGSLSNWFSFPCLDLLYLLVCQLPMDLLTEEDLAAQVLEEPCDGLCKLRRCFGETGFKGKIAILPPPCSAIKRSRNPLVALCAVSPSSGCLGHPRGHIQASRTLAAESCMVPFACLLQVVSACKQCHIQQ